MLGKKYERPYFFPSMRANAKERILERASQLASLVGLNGVTIGRLAAEVGMSKGGICAHFRSKSDLQVATVKRAAKVFRREVIEPAQVQPPGLPRINALNEAWFRYLESHVFEGGCFFVRTMMELAEQDLPARGVVRRNLGTLIAFVSEAAEYAVDAGHFHERIVPRQFAIQLHGIHVASLLWRAMGISPDPFETARKAAQEFIQQCQEPE
jgi:AcrR family transcriptional regulator